ncbi:ATP-dependent nuclease [Herbaspirillum huttiense]|uniref:ATP-dependent nuclease n=1 Tax=Herbaspirillum huttiense TaxID=863372 RepID=UPI0039AF42E2
MHYSEQSFEYLIEKISRFKPGKPLANYITHIRFPNFKNIAPGARIEFDFPVTALVGANGSGKTSVVHALYGAPKRASVSDFWFSTPLDPIISRQDNPQRFIYGHFHPDLNTVVETRKAQVGQNIDYWEPTKEVVEDGMSVGYGKKPLPAGRSKDRWNPVIRKVLYLNFRSELSAFDKYFFFSTLKQTSTLRSKQDRLRKWSALIFEALEAGRKRIFRRQGGRNLLSTVFDLQSDELAAVSYVLGKNYQAAKFIEHSVYGNEQGVSVLFKTRHGLRYSEAFAGSGEMAVVSFIAQVYRAKPGTLILLDEPEVSLHPGAQERLLKVVLAKVAEKFHQVVFSTHSPAMVRHLPPTAIKVFAENADGKFEIIENVFSATAFAHLGEPVPKKINIYVEDRLAKLIVDMVIKKTFSQQDAALFDVSYFSGGADTYFALRIPTLMHRQEQIYFLLDGDAKLEEFPDPAGIPENRYPELDNLIKACTGTQKIQYGADGGNDAAIKANKISLQKKYLKYLRDRVRFLPRPTPEQLILSALGLAPADAKMPDAKERLKQTVSDALIPTSTYEQTQLGAIALLARKLTEEANVPEIEAIATTLREIRANVGNAL